MARNDSQPTDKRKNVPVTPVKVETLDKSAQDSVPKPRSLFVATPVLKAARTRAWKTYEGFSEDEARAQSPSSVFVRLQISTKKLQQSGVPVIKTRWENSVAQEVVREREPATDNLLRTVAELTPQSDDNRVTADLIGANNELGAQLSKDSIHAQLLNDRDDRVETASRSANHSTEPRQLEHTTQPPNSSAGIEADLLSQTWNSIAQPTHNPILYPSAKQPSSTASESTGASQFTELYHPALFEALGNKKYAEKLSTNSFADSASKSPAKTGRLFSIGERDTIRSGTESSDTKSNITTQDVNGNTAQPSRLITGLSPFTKLTDQTWPLPANEQALDTVTSSTSSKRPINTRVTRRRQQQLITPTSNIRDSFNSEELDNIKEMAPVRDPSNVDNSLKDAIQKLYEVQSQVHGFVPETQPLLIEKMTELAQSLSHLQTLTSPTLSPNNPIHKNHIAPEVIDYVDDSRNPDIYNRLFVELVQRGNAVMNGKQQAFRDFSHIFAKALKEGMPELSEQVDKVMENANMSENKQNAQKPSGEGGANGAGKTEKKNEG